MFDRRRWLCAAAILLGGCASVPVPAPTAAPAAPVAPVAPVETASSKAKPPHYRCDGGLEFDVRFGDGSADLLFASRPPEALLRDAGGTSPQHVVYSSTNAKAEFGLGADGRDAKLNFVSPAIEARCKRD